MDPSVAPLPMPRPQGSIRAAVDHKEMPQYFATPPPPIPRPCANPFPPFRSPWAQIVRGKLGGKGDAQQCVPRDQFEQV